MANITISDLQVAELEYEELSDLELEAVVGGKPRPPSPPIIIDHSPGTVVIING
jgi:bacteriocin-like protein